MNELSGLSRPLTLRGKPAAHHPALQGRRSYRPGSGGAQTTFAQASAAYQDGAVRYRVGLAICKPDGGSDELHEADDEHCFKVSPQSGSSFGAIGRDTLPCERLRQDRKRKGSVVTCRPRQRGVPPSRKWFRWKEWSIRWSKPPSPPDKLDHKEIPCARARESKKDSCLPNWKQGFVRRRESSKGEFEQAEANYVTTVGASLPQQIQKSGTRRRRREVQLDAQQKVYESRKELFQKARIPRKDMDSAEVAFSSSSQPERASAKTTCRPPARWKRASP